MIQPQALAVLDQVRRAVVGKDAVVCKALMAILAKGHILLEDNPGLGKTTLALAFSKAMSLSYRRVQFTPEIMPADVVGFTMYDQRTGQFQYRPGAALCNLFLADELNRTSAKTQSALLEAMEEGQVTVDGVSHKLPVPYTVIATQNPVGSAGTQLLPESQLDRFMVRLSLGYPSLEQEVEILRQTEGERPVDGLQPVVSLADVADMQRQVGRVHVADDIYRYVAQLCAATREHALVRLGASPRAGGAWCASAGPLPGWPAGTSSSPGTCSCCFSTCWSTGSPWTPRPAWGTRTPTPCWPRSSRPWPPPGWCGKGGGRGHAAQQALLRAGAAGHGPVFPML